MYVPTIAPEEALSELVDAVLAMSRAGHDAAGAGAQERLIQALHDGRRTLEAPVVKVQCLHANSAPPTRSYDTDAGLDLYVSERAIIDPGSFVDVHHGVAIEFPPGWWGRLIGRSSTIRRRGLLVSEGTIDEGYRGELFAGIWNLGGKVQVLEVGDRVAQLVLCRTPPRGMVVELTNRLAPSDRGTSGFGSTG